MAEGILAAGGGIYAIRNTLNGKVYIGSAVNFRRRWWQHTSRLNIENHHSSKLQAAWEKYGAGAFVFEVLEPVSKELLIEREQHWIDARAAYGTNGYNMRPRAASSLGVKELPEITAKRSAALRGRKLTPEHRAKIAEAGRGQPMSEERRAKISAALSGKKKGALSEETRAKMSAARLGVKRGPMSAEQKAKLSEIHAGRQRGPLSDETKARISAAKIGKPYGKRIVNAA